MTTCSVEVSYYPLVDDFKPVVKAFIAELESCPEVRVYPGRISTQLIGEYRVVMDLLTRSMERIFADAPASVVIKVLNMDRSPRGEVIE